MKELKTKQLIAAQRQATSKAKKIIRALGLDDVVVKGNNVVRKKNNGTEEVLGKTRFPAVKGGKRKYLLKRE